MARLMDPGRMATTDRMTSASGHLARRLSGTSKRDKHGKIDSLSKSLKVLKGGVRGRYHPVLESLAE